LDATTLDVFVKVWLDFFLKFDQMDDIDKLDKIDDIMKQNHTNESGTNGRKLTLLILMQFITLMKIKNCLKFSMTHMKLWINEIDDVDEITHI
jgi:hypothetical protein